LSLPGAYRGAEYTYLAGTGTNTTHWTLTTLCRGCTTWADSDGNTVTLNTTGTAGLAWAKATSKPTNPASNISTFNFHNGFGSWKHDLAGAQSPLFDYWVSNNLLSSAPTTSSLSTSTPRTPSATLNMTTSYILTLTTSVTFATTTSTAIYQTSVPTICAGVAVAQYPGILKDGWRATKVKGGMTGTRGVILDTAGHILTVESGKGISVHTVGFDGCITDSKTLIAQNNLNHGILLNPNGTTLYASSMTTVWAWPYDPIAAAVLGSATIVVSGMFNGGHPTRSLVMSPAYSNLLVVSHGSDENIDIASINMSTARAIVKIFDMSSVPIGGYKYATDGYNAGYGLRNEVGLTFDANNM
jgi:glucose/arabinose dehydrogenase